MSDTQVEYLSGVIDELQEKITNMGIAIVVANCYQQDVMQALKGYFDGIHSQLRTVHMIANATDEHYPGALER